MTTGRRAGALTLAGSGEYTSAMTPADQQILATLGGPQQARVVVIPTASALEPGQPERWNSMGLDHYRSMGAAVTAMLLLTRTDAADQALVATINQHNFYYFSGGSPDYAIETLQETPVWAALRANYAAGAAIGGCSAGAMMLGGYTLSIRSMRSGGPPIWRPALGLLPQLAILPHFDRMRGFMTQKVFEEVLAVAPPGLTLVGIDEDTALLCLPEPGGPRWVVSGRQSISVISRDGVLVYRDSESVPLPDPD
ncbi:MAG: Type 1 glutamine amidotransferase-like domain-containing protein [Roseiflexaceae bacterium]|nr:Type 1 glutamine amidotransferase-like domain-containing protein [Roseiflexaceae bacterium]